MSLGIKLSRLEEDLDNGFPAKRKEPPLPLELQQRVREVLLAARARQAAAEADEVRRLRSGA